VNIYGSPLETSGDHTDLMNNNPEVASTWKGRVLVQIQGEKTDKPILEVKDIDEEGKKGAL
jgi:hypothetical protein